MGKLLSLSLVTTLAAAVLFQPILMGPPRQATEPSREPRAEPVAATPATGKKAKRVKGSAQAASSRRSRRKRKNSSPSLKRRFIISGLRTISPTMAAIFGAQK